MVTVSALLIACSGDEGEPCSGLDCWAGDYVTAVVEITDNPCKIGLSADDQPHVGDTFTLLIEEGAERPVILNECRPPEPINCKDHFPNDWEVHGEQLEDKHTDDLYADNEDDAGADCKLLAYSHWIAQRIDVGLNIQLTVEMDPQGTECEPEDLQFQGCKATKTVTAARL